VDKVQGIGVVAVPELGFDDPHFLTVDLYRSMPESAQSRYYEPSDYQMARSTLFFLDQQFKAGRPSGQLLATLFSQLTDLLFTEGSRRRAIMEVERASAGADVTDAAEFYKRRFAAEGS
jgi:hypothetical protein